MLDFVRRPHSSPERVRRFQLLALQRIVRHAATRVPYYREIFRRVGLHPNDIQAAEDLRHIPVTTKDELQSRPIEEFLTEGYDVSRSVRLTTSGSTGRPTIVIRSRWEQLKLQTYRLRSQALCGVRASDQRASLNTRAQGVEPWRFGLYRMESLNQDDPTQLVRLLRQLRPDVILSRPTILEMAAGEAQRLPGENPPCRLLFAGAEVLTPQARDLFARTWQCRVLEEYGTNEFLLVASECPRCGLLHTCDDAVLVELLRDGNPVAPGKSGKVVGTGLHSFVMPFIRFDLDDVARRPVEAADCSSPFDAIEVIEGRTMDFLRLPGGGVLSPYEIQRAIQDVAGVRKFEVEQQSLDALIVRLEQSVGANCSTAVLHALRRSVPQEVKISLQAVESIAAPPSGKHRYIRGFVVRP